MSKKKPKTFIDSVVAHDPEINVIEKEIMDERISIVFNQIASTLQKSLGPTGAHAIISQAPNYHVTKDGFTIMKNIRYNSKYGYVDQVIAGMISDICGRLNFAVGDGTTSAVLSANAMYQNFNENSEELRKLFFLPRNVLSRTKKLTEDVIKRLESYAFDIKSLPEDEMCEYIRQVVYISSNADVEMTDTIVNLYKEIGYPAISVVKAADGITKGRTIEGFMFHAKLMDRLYVNNDNNSQHGTNYDVIIFDHKVSLSTYKHILSPLSFMCGLRGRKLICIAPNYDEVALQGDILNDLNNEYRRTHDINLVLMGYRATRNSDKKRISDLAMLCNTQIITQNIETELTKRMAIVLESPDLHNSLEFINLDMRELPGTKVMVVDENNNPSIGEYFEGFKSMFELNKDFSFRVGYCGEASLFVDKESIFGGFSYDESLYGKYVSDAEKELNDAIEKYKRLGTFNFEVDDAQKRYLSLKLKMGQIEVGAKTDFSQEFMIDVMDDAVKAAESAYRNGIIHGGHTTLLKAIQDEIDKVEHNDGDLFLLRTMFKAFRHVRFRVLENGFSNIEVDISDLIRYHEDRNSPIHKSEGELVLDLISKCIGVKVKFDSDIHDIDGFLRCECTTEYSKDDTSKINKDTRSKIKLFELINDLELYTNTVLNLDMGDGSEPCIAFDRKVINSTATDREILIASSDLVGLLTTGNQLVISRGNC